MHETLGRVRASHFRQRCAVYMRSFPLLFGVKSILGNKVTRAELSMYSASFIMYTALEMTNQDWRFIYLTRLKFPATNHSKSIRRKMSSTKRKALGTELQRRVRARRESSEEFESSSVQSLNGDEPEESRDSDSNIEDEEVCSPNLSELEI
jgi:hypothetical protein